MEGVVGVGSIPIGTLSTRNIPGGAWNYHPLSGPAYGQVVKLTTIYDNFFTFFVFRIFYRGVPLLLEKGVVKCVKPLQGFCLIDSS